MNPEIENLVKEWKEKSENDLGSAQLLLKETNYYEISAYHSHQSIEKILKAEILKEGKSFKFTHDLNSLFLQVLDEESNLFDKVSYVNSLYPLLRYQSGDKILKSQAEEALQIAREIFLFFKKEI